MNELGFLSTQPVIGKVCLVFLEKNNIHLVISFIYFTGPMITHLLI